MIILPYAIDICLHYIDICLHYTGLYSYDTVCRLYYKDICPYNSAAPAQYGHHAKRGNVRVIIKTLPGTTIELPHSMHSIRAFSSSLFAGGGLTLAQVCSMTNLPPHVLQSWVKRGFVSTPPKKRYTQNQFFRIALFNLLKDHMQMENIVKLLNYVNMNLPEGSAKKTDESAIYQYFVEALFLTDNYYLDRLDAIANIALKSFNEPYPGMRKRLAIIIRIMVILYISSQIKSSADLLLRNIGL